MDLSQGLYVTAMGMGIVFFALALLMAAIMLLDRLFPYRAEAEETAPAEAAESAPLAPAQAAMGDRARTPPDGTPMEALLGDERHRVELRDVVSQPMLVVVDGEEHRVEQRDGGSPRLVVDGQPYPARVVEVAPDHVAVSVGDQVFRVEMPVGSPVRAPAGNGASSAPPAKPSGLVVPAPLPGRILKVTVAPGARVSRGQEICVVEAMKMENSIRAPEDGVVREVRVQQGQTVKPGDALVVMGE